MITVKSNETYDLFRQGKRVYKVTATSIYNNERCREVGMVMTNKDYEHILVSHRYTPLLYTVDKYILLAYANGCLNTSFRKHRGESFTFWWRDVGDKRWNEWFVVEPYIDSIYDEIHSPWERTNQNLSCPN